MARLLRGRTGALRILECVFMSTTSRLQTEPKQNLRLGVLITRNDLPSQREQESFFSQFGRQHSFIVKSRIGGFKVFSFSGTLRIPFESLPVDYLYSPDNWEARLTDDQIRNVLLSLSHSQNDFLIVSASLSQFPLVSVSSIRNQTIFSKELGLEFPEPETAKQARGKILRLLPSDHAVTELNVEELFRERSVTWAPEPCWPPRMIGQRDACAASCG